MRDDIDTTDLCVGDAFDLRGGSQLVIVGVCTDMPDDDAVLYEARRDGADGTMLYRPHHFDHALGAGAEYVGREVVADATSPFWCQGCDCQRRGRAQGEYSGIDAPACSWSCSRNIFQAELQARIDGRGER